MRVARGPARRQTGAGDRYLAAGSSALLAACTVVYLVWPQGIGALAFVGVSAAGLVGLVVGPLLRRARPRGAWRWIALGGSLFLVSLALRIGVVPAAGSPLTSPDLWSIAGYLATARGLSGLLAHATRGSSRSAALDATIVTAGAALGFFSVELGPHLRRGESLATVVLDMSYPIMDAALLSLTAHLALRSWRRSTSLVLLLSSMTALLLGDLAYVVLWHVSPFATSPWINAVFMLAYALIGASGVHPSVTSLAAPAPDARPQSTGSFTLLLLTLVVPAALAVLSAPSGWADSAIRVGLLGVVLFSVHLRMRYTINALSEAAAALERSQQQALHQALHDTLTGLPNRAALRASLTRRLDPAAGVGGTAVLYLDSDHFKRVNDTWGHPAGDTVIQGLADRLKAALGPGDELFRLGGDEFVVVKPGDAGSDPQDTAERLLAAAAQPFVLDSGQKVTLSASVGVSLTDPGLPADADSMLRDADIAMYAAKDAGRATWTLFDDSLRSGLERRVTLAEELRDAVAAGEIIPFFQPIMTGAGFGQVCGFEALARWIRPDGVQVGPVEFIPIAEDTGLIVEIGQQILSAACTYLARWRLATSQDLHVSVNVSAGQLARCDVPALVADVLNTTGLPPRALWLEITESLLVHDRDQAMTTLHRLSELGVVLCIDDFGTGYSSLSYLQDFPVDVVKIDRAFVKSLTTDLKSQGLTRAIIDMVRALNLHGVVAEGVDQAGQAELLESWGCDWGQGFLWSKPLPPAQVAVLLDLGTLAVATTATDGP
jgi:diguanylate cyclase